MRFAALGPLEVVADVAVAVERPSHRRMLSVLLLEADRAIPVDRLIDRFWSGDPPASAKGAIHTHVAALRRLLGDELIQTRASGYVLDLDGHAYDVAEFERAVHRATEAAETGRWDVAIEAAGRALELWRGPPLPELADDAFAGRRSCVSRSSGCLRSRRWPRVSSPSDAPSRSCPTSSARPSSIPSGSGSGSC